MQTELIGWVGGGAGMHDGLGRVHNHLQFIFVLECVVPYHPDRMLCMLRM